MTELMKRYEADFEKGLIHASYESWLEAKVLDGKTIEKFQEIIRTQCDEISALKAQLTWRSVSEKPEKEGWYFVLCSVACDVLESVALYKNGKWDDENVWKWLPIPPAPEGE